MVLEVTYIVTLAVFIGYMNNSNLPLYKSAFTWRLGVFIFQF